MKKIRFIMVCILAVLATLISEDVLAITCEYEYQYVLKDNGSIDKSATAYNGETVSFEINNGQPSINFKNWKSGQTTCPDYVVKKLTNVSGGFMCIGATKTYSYWGFDAGIDWESNEAKDAREFLDLGICAGGTATKVFKNYTPENPSKPPIVCEYDGFNLNIDPDSHALSADSTQNNISYNYIYDVDGGLNDEWFHDDGTLGKCLSVLVCFDKSIPPVSNHQTGDYSPGTMNYTVYMDELHVPKNEYGDGDCEKVSYSGGATEKIPEKQEHDCTTYYNRIGELRTLYSALGTAKKNGTDSLSMYNEVEQKSYLLKKMCESAYAGFDYSYGCVKACVGYEAELAVIKSENGFGVGTAGGSSSCSFSQRITNWIFKIVKWFRYLVPILLIVLSVMDFIKAIASNSEDEIRKVGAKFVKRLIVAAIIFVLPLILEFLLGIFGISANNYCL